MIDYLNSLVLSVVNSNISISGSIAYGIAGLLLLTHLCNKKLTDDVHLILFCVHIVAHFMFLFSLRGTYHWLTLFILAVVFYLLWYWAECWLDMVRKRYKGN